MWAHAHAHAHTLIIMLFYVIFYDSYKSPKGFIMNLFFKPSHIPPLCPLQIPHICTVKPT